MDATPKTWVNPRNVQHETVESRGVDSLSRGRVVEYAKGGEDCVTPSRLTSRRGGSQRSFELMHGRERPILIVAIQSELVVWRGWPRRCRHNLSLHPVRCSVAPRCEETRQGATPLMPQASIAFLFSLCATSIRRGFARSATGIVTMSTPFS